MQGAAMQGTAKQGADKQGADKQGTDKQGTAIAVFVKTPGLSPVKTRLAATIGSTAAEGFYRLSCQAIEQTLQHLTKTVAVSPFWAVGEIDGLAHPLWQGFESIHTGEGDLGERQHHIYQTLLAKYPRVILIGADSPQLSARHLNSAITALDKHSFALGPAVDGGYYLLAGRAPIRKEIWTGVTYSSADTAQQLLAQLPSTAAILDCITDVDTVADLEVLKSELRAEPAITKTQKDVIDYIVKDVM
jgi:rSAM/selenodomain-associated transferase 1